MDIAAARYDIGTAGEMHHDPSRNVLYVAESVEAIATTNPPRHLGRARRMLDSASVKLRAARGATADAFRRSDPLYQLERDDGVGTLACRPGAG